MADILLYGLDEGGQIVFTEQLAAAERPRLRAIAEARLGRCAAVEVWDGQICVVRLRRPDA